MRLIIFPLIYFCFITFSAKSQVIYAPKNDKNNYIVKILTHVLSYTPSKDYQLKLYDKHIPKVRVFELIANNTEIDIIAAGATFEREAKLRPIRFPLLKGLNGWRIPLVNTKNTQLFTNTKTKSEFIKFIPGQLHSWSDTRILESNGIQVENVSNYLGLFDMLEKGRFDYFPLSVFEVSKELEKHPNYNIVIEQNILIHYPTAYYFYVSKDNEDLAIDIERGLESSLKDGSFELLFQEYYGQVIDNVRKEQRRIYHLNNPLLPEKAPTNRAELWIDLSPPN